MPPRTSGASPRMRSRVFPKSFAGLNRRGIKRIEPDTLRALLILGVSASSRIGIACMLEEYEHIDNIKLIRNNLLHINCEIDSLEPSPMRLAKECYQLFLRMMVEALRGTANIAITGKPTKNRRRWYRQGNDPWKVIQKKNLGKSDWEVIKEHPVIAYKILSKVQWPWPILEIVRHHHEHFDGTGYPDHLKGANIPLTARILAVVDAWDSMLHDQHYRQRLTRKKALSELKRCRKSMFDPFVVDKFIEMVNKTGFQITEPVEKRYRAAG